MIDGRDMFEPKEMIRLRFTHYPTGRTTVV